MIGGQGGCSQDEKVKVLADGDLSVALTVSVDKVSKQAAEKIAKAGGSVKVVSVSPGGAAVTRFSTGSAEAVSSNPRVSRHGAGG